MWLLMLACAPIEPSWDLLTPVPVDCVPGEAAASGEVTPTPDAVEHEGEWEEMFRLRACADDPLNCDGAGEPSPVEDSEPAVADVEEPEAAPPEPEPVAEEAPAVARSSELPAPTGLATQPGWGLRLLQTLPQAQPPRAAIGLPDGRELVVSPGSMVPEAGVVVIAVGSGSAQFAHVTPAGDHAVIETLTLHAQYGGAPLP